MKERLDVLLVSQGAGVLPGRKQKQLSCQETYCVNGQREDKAGTHVRREGAPSTVRGQSR